MTDKLKCDDCLSVFHIMLKNKRYSIFAGFNIILKCVCYH